MEHGLGGPIEDKANRHASAPHHGQVCKVAVLRLLIVLLKERMEKVSPTGLAEFHVAIVIHQREEVHQPIVLADTVSLQLDAPGR